MPSSVHIWQGQSRYDVFSRWQDALGQAFRRQGLDVTLRSVNDPAVPAKPCSFSIGFNLVRAWTPAGRAERHVAWLVDHPCHHGALFTPQSTGLPMDPAACLALCVDEEWTAFAQQLYREPPVHFVPHPPSVETVQDPDWSRREWDVVMFGTGEDSETLHASLKQESGPWWPLLEGVLKHMAPDLGASAPGLLWHLLEQSELPRDQALILMHGWLPKLTQYYLYAQERPRLLAAFKHQTVHVFGNGPWARLKLPSSVVVHGPLSSADTVAAMRRSRVVLNHSPTLAHGAHERIFDALACGCKVLTTPSTFVRNAFGSEGAVTFYSAKTMPALDEHMAALLSDPDAADRIRQAQKTLQADHTMDRRVETICNRVAQRWPEGLS